MAVIRYRNPFGFPNPFQELARVQREMDRLFSQIMGRGSGVTASGVFPALNVSEDADRITVTAELPGIGAEDIEISVVGKTLTLRGERKPDVAENAKAITAGNAWRGNFRRP